jgi:hypothetical protein
MSEGGVGTVIRHTLGDSTLLRGDGGLLEAASGLDALAAATIGRIGLSTRCRQPPRSLGY